MRVPTGALHCPSVRTTRQSGDRDSGSEANPAETSLRSRHAQPPPPGVPNTPHPPCCARHPHGVPSGTAPPGLAPPWGAPVGTCPAATPRRLHLLPLDASQYLRSCCPSRAAMTAIAATAAAGAGTGGGGGGGCRRDSGGGGRGHWVTPTPRHLSSVLWRLATATTTAEEEFWPKLTREERPRRASDPCRHVHRLVLHPASAARHRRPSDGSGGSRQPQPDRCCRRAGRNRRSSCPPNHRGS